MKVRGAEVIKNFINQSAHHLFIIWNVNRVMNQTTNDQKRTIYSDGVVSTEHSASELRVIGTNAHRDDSYFLHLRMRI